jgi:hypothetical protein
MAPGIRVLLTIAGLDRLAPLPCMDVCPVCGSDQVHGQACIATRLFRTIARLGDGESAGQRLQEIAIVDATFLRARGIVPHRGGKRRYILRQNCLMDEHSSTPRKRYSTRSHLSERLVCLE